MCYRQVDFLFLVLCCIRLVKRGTEQRPNYWNLSRHVQNGCALELGQLCRFRGLLSLYLWQNVAVGVVAGPGAACVSPLCSGVMPTLRRADFGALVGWFPSSAMWALQIPSSFRTLLPSGTKTEEIFGEFLQREE